MSTTATNDQEHPLQDVPLGPASGSAYTGPQQPGDAFPASVPGFPSESPVELPLATTSAGVSSPGVEPSGFHVDLYEAGQHSGSAAAAEEQQSPRATQTTPIAETLAAAERQLYHQQQLIAAVEQQLNQQQRQRQQQAAVRRRRARRRRWRLLIASKFYAVKIALASKNGKLITTCGAAVIQICAIIALLILSSRLGSPAAPGLSQWDACPRHLQAFDIIQVGKAAVGLWINLWWILRQPSESLPTTGLGRFAYRLRQDFLPYFTAILHIILSAVLFSTLTGSPTTWDYSPTIFFACIVALFRTWLAVAEVVLLVVGGALYAICYASLAIFCPSILPRRATRLTGINPTIGPLSPTQLSTIPIVQYASMSTVSLALPTSPPRTLERLRIKRADTTRLSAPPAPGKGPKRYKIEKHRAACAICLNDFIDMKRVSSAPLIEPPQSAGGQSAGIPTSPTSSTSPVSPTRTSLSSPASPIAPRRSTEGTGVDTEDGEEATIPVVFMQTGAFHVPPLPPLTEPEELRLLPCDHVFHKDCIDPWLKDVSGRCPTCQRPVFGENSDAV